MQSPPPQSVPTPTLSRHINNNSNSSLAPPGPSRTGASPGSYGAMTGISFTNGGGFSFEGRHGVPVGGGGGGTGMTPKSYKRNLSGLGGMTMGVDSPSNANGFSTSINMEPGSAFSTSANAFGLGSSSMMMSSSLRRSYASAVLGRGEPMNLSSSFASMSFQPMSLGTSYSKSQVHHLINRSDAELTKSYVCCGMTLDGLHSLLEHVEDAHPAGDESGAAAGTDGTVDNAIAMDMELEDIPEASGSSTRSSLSPKPTGPTYAIPPTAASSKPATPDIEKSAAPFSSSALSISDVLTSPSIIDEPVSTTKTASKSSSSSSSPADGTLTTPTTSKQPSPVFAPKVNPTRGFFGVAQQQPYASVHQKRLDRAFNEVVAGRKEDGQRADKNEIPRAVAPGVLFASTVAGLGIPTTPPVPGAPGQTTPKEGENSKSNDPPLPAPSLFSTHKPWRCPNPGCNKAYKQSNGLKYHQQKGQCDFAIHEAVDLGLSIEEAEERNRPFVCAVGAGCTKRYRQMNGLKYHYLNSGEHGQYGLRMLQNGTHPQPPSVPTPPPKRYPPSSNSAITNSRPSAAPYHIPSHHQNQNQSHHTSSHHQVQSGHGTNGSNANVNGGANGMHGTNSANTTPKPMPRMGVWPNKTPLSNHTTPTANRVLPQSQSQSQSHAQTQARQPIIPPITKGKDAVLYSNVGSTDPMDIMSRMD